MVSKDKTAEIKCNENIFFERQLYDKMLLADLHSLAAPDYNK